VNRQFIKSQVLSLSELKSLTKLNNKIYINSKGYKSSEIAFQGHITCFMSHRTVDKKDIKIFNGNTGTQMKALVMWMILIVNF